MTTTNTRVVLSRRPTGEATGDCFALKTEELEEQPQGMVRVAVDYISVDAGTRTMLKGEGFHNQVEMGDTFVVSAAAAELAQRYADGSIVLPEEILVGIERYPEAPEFMFAGGNLGKLLVKAS